MSLRNFFRGVIAKVVIGRDEERHPFYSVHFKDSKDVITVEISNAHNPDRKYIVSLNGTWQIRATF